MGDQSRRKAGRVPAREWQVIFCPQDTWGSGSILSEQEVRSLKTRGFLLVGTVLQDIQTKETWRIE